MTDPISDFLTRLRNASKARLDECVPHSTLKESHRRHPQDRGLRRRPQRRHRRAGPQDPRRENEIRRRRPRHHRPHRVSTPGRRLYFRYTEIPRVLNGLGIGIVSTSKGLMKDADCRRNKAGGELICNVW